MIRSLRVSVLYPERMNLYADRGNLLVLQQRCRRRGIGCVVSSLSVGGNLAPGDADLVYLGGGQDRDQRRCGSDLLRHRQALAEAAASGSVVLGICGGYQLLGHRYRTTGGTIDGIGLLDVTTLADDHPRTVGPVVLDVGSKDNGFGGHPWAKDDGPNAGGEPSSRLGLGRRLVGFENHQGRTTLGPGVTPLGTVLVGGGNNGVDGTEGAVSGTVIGTYLHGPLLAKNVWFADLLIEMALGTTLQPIEDRFEDQVHRVALAEAVGEVVRRPVRTRAWRGSLKPR